MGSKYSEAGTLNNIANVYRKQSKYEEALSILFNSLMLQKEINAPVILIETLLIISQAYENMGDYDNSLKYHKEYFEKFSNQFNESNSQRLMQIQADLGARERELKIRNLELLAKAEKENNAKQNRYFLVFAVLFVAVFVLLINRYQFVKRARNQYQKLSSDLKSKSIQLAEANESLATLSKTDSLTGLVNRRGFDEQLDLQISIAARNKESLALLMIDIDFFKAYNDCYGHQQGDNCLQQVAQLLKNSLTLNRPGDLLARYGGEEFVVILADPSNAHAAELAAEVRESVFRASIEHQGSDCQTPPVLTVSVGLAHGNDLRQISPECLLSNADTALYQAKKLGRNQVVTADFQGLRP